MIIVAGATGNPGRQIIERLPARGPADRVGVSVRDPEKAKSFADQGVRVRQAASRTPAVSTVPSRAPPRC